MMRPSNPKLKHINHTSRTFISLLIKRIDSDRLTTTAAGLAYTTILALVPLITVIFFLLAAFPMFSDVSVVFKDFIYSNLVPTAGETIQQYLEQFIANSNKMTVFGICGLMVTSLLLIRSIDNALNLIWKTQRKRSIFYNLAIYWTVLTLGPILIGASIAVSSYIFSMTWLSETVSSIGLLKLLQFMISVLGFWLLYCIVPTEPIPMKESLIGAIVAAALFELGKRAFTLYVTSFPTYQLIYGVLASIPILLVWIYFSWCIVLFGAEFSATLTEYRKQLKLSKPE
ncbi:virulence factor BrkB family protein [Zophobihabitans entericus]|nr:virulence factor BrkB family protein [Zophobihabitans entericus]